MPLGLSDRSSPFVGAYVLGVSREEPMVSVEVNSAVLPFSIFGLVEILDNSGAL